MNIFNRRKQKEAARLANQFRPRFATIIVNDIEEIDLTSETWRDWSVEAVWVTETATLVHLQRK